MNKEKYNQIIDEAYKNYQNKRSFANKDNVRVPHTLPNGMTGQISRPFTKEEFINKCKTDQEFSQKWGLKIEERELTFEQRCEIYVKKLDGTHSNEKDIFIKHCTEDIKLIKMNENNIPTKLITITYNNETIEVYE